MRCAASCVATRVQGVLSPIQQAEREDAIADWLADHGVDAASPSPLAETAVTIEALDRIAGGVNGPALTAVLRWAAAGCAVRALASEIQEAAMRISGLVTAVKGFTHMDQATVAEPVDVGSEPEQHRRGPQVEGPVEIGHRHGHRGSGPAARQRASSASSTRSGRI